MNKYSRPPLNEKWTGPINKDDTVHKTERVNLLMIIFWILDNDCLEPSLEYSNQDAQKVIQSHVRQSFIMKLRWGKEKRQPLTKLKG